MAFWTCDGKGWGFLGSGSRIGRGSITKTHCLVVYDLGSTLGPSRWGRIRNRNNNRHHQWHLPSSTKNNHPHRHHHHQHHHRRRHRHVIVTAIVIVIASVITVTVIIIIIIIISSSSSIIVFFFFIQYYRARLPSFWDRLCTFTPVSPTLIWEIPFWSGCFNASLLEKHIRLAKQQFLSHL